MHRHLGGQRGRLDALYPPGHAAAPGRAVRAVQRRLATGRRVIQTPLSIFHQGFSVQDILSGVRMTLTSRASAARFCRGVSNDTSAQLFWKPTFRRRR
jgi:hypothetical protein